MPKVKDSLAIALSRSVAYPRRNQFGLAFLFSLGALIHPRVGLSQDPVAPTQDTARQIAETDDTPPAPEAWIGDRKQDDNSPEKSEIDSLKSQVQTLTNEVSSLRNEMEDLSGTVEILEEGSFEEVSDASTRLLSVYGFFDLTFEWIFPHDGSFFDGLLNEHPSFAVQGLNLYFYSVMTDTLSAIAELRFTFYPLGQVKSFEVNELGMSYERVDTYVQNQFTEEEFRLGGVLIERVHLTYRPLEWLGIIAGHYLTPCGIWNIDHGSPLLIPVRHPFMHTRKYIPLAQTGIQLFGRIIPKPGQYIDYGFTLSNGRGPMDTILDFDRNKGLGLRLSYTWESTQGKISVGGYGYRGDVTDHKQILVSTEPFNVDTVNTLRYTEFVGELDLLVEFFNFRFQTEFLRGRINYDDDLRPVRAASRGVGYQPDYIYQDVYFMLAYTLPLERYLGTFEITPYFLYELSDIDDAAVDDLLSHIFIAGLNLRPSPYVVLKLEYTDKITPYWENHGADFRIVSAQMAVSF